MKKSPTKPLANKTPVTSPESLRKISAAFWPGKVGEFYQLTKSHMMDAAKQGEKYAVLPGANEVLDHTNYSAEEWGKVIRKLHRDVLALFRKEGFKIRDKGEMAVCW